MEHLRPDTQYHPQTLQALCSMGRAVQAVEQRRHHALDSAVCPSLEQDTECCACCLAYGGVWVAESALDGGQDVCQVLCQLVASDVLKQLQVCRVERGGGGGNSSMSQWCVANEATSPKRCGMKSYDTAI